MDEQQIKSEIQRIIGINYSAWTIGVTDRPEQRRTEHNNPSFWHQWDADSEQIARNVEAYFINKGCKGDTGGPGTADYVYIFK